MHGKLTAVTAAILVAGCTSTTTIATTTAGSAATAPWHAGTKAQAIAEARHLLAEFRVPPGGTRVSQSAVPPTLRSRPAPGDGWVSATEYLVVPRDPKVIIAFLASPPLSSPMTAGADLVGSSVGAYLDAPAAGIDAGIVSVVIEPYAAGKALLAATVSTAWLPYRTAAEYVDPSVFRSVTATMRFVSVTPGPARTRTFTSPVTIAKLADLLNASAPMPRIILTGRHCTPFGATYTLTFTPRPARGSAIVVTLGLCGGIGVTAGRDQQPALWDPGSRLASLTSTLLGNPQPAPVNTKSLAPAP
jgi:hypothetical protein